MTKRIIVRALAGLGIAGLVAAGLLVTPQPGALAQGRLIIGGNNANFGIQNINAGFMPDPRSVNIRSGGNLDIRPMGLGPSCRGHATATPDLIVNYRGTSPTGNLRFYFRPNRRGQDTTLVINDATGSWHCDDDGGGNLNPMVTLNRPPSGQYDIWVGSYRDGEFIDGQLFITELTSNRP